MAHKKYIKKIHKKIIHVNSAKLKIEGKDLHKIKPTDGLLENQDEDVSIRNIHTTKTKTKSLSQN